MVKSIYKNINSRKFKYFLVFLAISFSVWFFGRLSEVYQSDIQLKVAYVEVPSNLFSAINNPKTITVKVRAKGFALMRSQINKYHITLSMGNLESKSGIYHMSTENLINQIKSQLPAHLEFLSVNTSDLNISLFELKSKKVPVNALVNFRLMPDYIIDQISVEPDSIVISGSEEELKKYCSINTIYTRLNKVDKDVTSELQLEIPQDAFNLKLSQESVTLNASVARYMDRYYELDIQQINSSDSLILKTFPSRVRLVAYALVKDLKEFDKSDFKVFVDAQKAMENNSEVLELHLKVNNPKIRSAFLLEKQVEYILR